MSREPRPSRPVDDSLRLSRETRGTTAIVHAGGEIDMVTAPSLMAALTDCASDGHRPALVVLDLRAITFMSSAGLMILNHHHRRFTGLGVSFVVVADQQAVLRVLDLTGVSDLVKVLPHLEDVPAP